MPLNGHSKSSKELLHPYLDGILDLNPACQSIFQLFYMQYFAASDQLPEDIASNFFILPHLQPDIFQTVDQAVHDAENAFWSIMQAVGSQSIVDREKGIWMDHSKDNINEPDVD